MEKDILRYVIANIVGSVFALCITGVLAIKYGLYGALVALALYQSISFLSPFTSVKKPVGSGCAICLAR